MSPPLTGPPQVLPLVPQLRERLAATLPADTRLWGAELLNAADEAGTTVLGKCVHGRPAVPAPRGQFPSEQKTLSPGKVLGGFLAAPPPQHLRTRSPRAARPTVPL